MKEVDIKKLLDWYQKNKRDLPWRKTSDPYKIWISEVMLQQTRVETVVDYYTRFLKFLPTIHDLAHVKEDQLLKLWEGLGYYSRARNLKKCAQKVMDLGLSSLPSDESLLKTLPGIGPYTAGAILSISYQKCFPAIDGNVLRVLSRVYEDDRDLLKKSVRESYENLLKKFMTKENARSFTEGFIELGALVCIPNGVPLCENCPLRSCCKSKKHDTMLEYPKKKKKKSRKIVSKTVYILKYQDTYAIRKRKEGVLVGMYELPNVDETFTKEQLGQFLTQKNDSYSSIRFIGNFKHIFSHLEWHMKAYLVNLNEKPKNYKFYSKETIAQKYSLPTAFSQIFQKIP